MKEDYGKVQGCAYLKFLKGTLGLLLVFLVGIFHLCFVTWGGKGS